MANLKKDKKDNNYCDVCNCKVNFKDSKTKEQHINGRKHQSRLNRQEEESKQLKYGTAEYFMKHESKKSVKEKVSKAMKKLDRNLSIDVDTSKCKNIESYAKSKYEKMFDMCPPNIVNPLKKLDYSSLELVKELLDICPRCIDMFKNRRFIKILRGNEGDNIIQLLYYSLKPGYSIPDSFEIFYNHSTMRVYFADLLSQLFDFPFTIKYKMYQMSREYNIKIFSQLFNRYTNKNDAKIEIICSKIDQMHKYYHLMKDMETGNSIRAQHKINKNNNERSAFLEETFLEARNRWDKNVADMA